MGLPVKFDQYFLFGGGNWLMNKATKNELATFLVNLYFHANKSVRCYMLRVFCNKCQQYSEKTEHDHFLIFFNVKATHIYLLYIMYKETFLYQDN